MTAVGTALLDARKAAGLSQADASRLAGLNRVVLSFYETGQRQPSLIHLRRLAGAYGVDAGALLAGKVENDLMAPARVLFRSSSWVQTADTRVRINDVLRVVAFYADVLADLKSPTAAWTASRFGRAKGRQTRRYAVAKAHEVRRSFGLGETTVADLSALAGEVALVFRVPLGDLDLAPSGLSWLHPRAGFCIVVNSSVRATHQRFTLAHELAHVLFHLDQPEIAIVSLARDIDDQERFANAFAGELLVPGPALIELGEELQGWERLDDPGTVVRLADRFDVSYAAMLVRLRQEKLISPGEFNDLQRASPTAIRAGLGLPPDRAGAQAGDPIEIPPCIYQLARRSFLEGIAGEGAIAEGLGIDREAVQRLVRPASATADEQAEADWFGQRGEFREASNR